MKLKLPGRRGWLLGGVSGAVALLLPYVLPMGEEHHGFWDGVFGWWGAYGLLGCAAIVLVSKWLGAVLLQKPEDWYD